MLHLFLVLLLYAALSVVSMSVVWVMIARKGFAGLESSKSSLAKFFRRFEKGKSAPYVRAEFFGTNPASAGVGLSSFGSPVVIPLGMPQPVENGIFTVSVPGLRTSAGSVSKFLESPATESYAHGTSA